MIKDGEESKYLVPPLPKVDLANPVGVDGVPLVWVNNNLHQFFREFHHQLFQTYHKQARVGVDHLGLVSCLQVPKDRCVVEEGQVDHVLALLKLWGVDTTNVTGLESKGNKSDPDSPAIF